MLLGRYQRKPKAATTHAAPSVAQVKHLTNTHLNCGNAICFNQGILKDRLLSIERFLVPLAVILRHKLYSRCCRRYYVKSLPHNYLQSVFRLTDTQVRNRLSICSIVRLSCTVPTPLVSSLSGANHRSAQVLLLLVLPGHLIFLYTIHLMKSGHTTLTPIFMTVYLAAALLQVSGVRVCVRWGGRGSSFANYP